MSKHEDSNTPAGRKSNGSAAARKKTDAAFDLWLHRGLHEIFDGVTHEPIPEEFLRLIEEDRGK